MDGRILPDNLQSNSSADATRQKQQSIQQAQEVIYQCLINSINQSSPETVLLEFEQLFIACDNTLNSEANQALYEIIFQNNEEEFRNTLKRACYILINNWSSQRNYQAIQTLIQILADAKLKDYTLSRSLRRLRTWLVNFIESEDYQELKLFALPYTSQERGNWSHRYASFLLVSQYLDSKNPLEQREVAKNLAKGLKEKFKFDLAMYTVHCNLLTFKEEQASNPTQLGSGVIRLLTNLISKNFLFNYSKYADLFIRQTKDLNYRDFKQSLQNYLLFSAGSLTTLDVLKNTFEQKLDGLYETHHDETITVELLLRTCRRIIEFLTTENGYEPSSLFIVLTTQGSPLTIVITLLKIVLICTYARNHLDVCVAKLIRYYENYPEKDCQWFINFLDSFNIVFAIYTENVQYNLIKVGDNESDSQNVYRIFSQLKGADLRGSNLSGADFRSTNLNAADLRQSNLSGADLSNADLSLAKLSNANLRSATLNGTELIATDLQGADLNDASLREANLSRSNLQKTNLVCASLIAAKLRCANLYQADLQQACLQQTDLSDANLSEANLRGANLHRANLNGASLNEAHLVKANLSHTDLTHANLRGADLRGAILRHATLSHADLSQVDLSNADLSHADLSYGDLRGIDLSCTILRHVNLRGANLNHANLSGANLFSTNLSAASVRGARFRENSGLSAEKQRNLAQRGAIIEPSSCTASDRNPSEIVSPNGD